MSNKEQVKTNWEKVNSLLHGATFHHIDADLDIVLQAVDGRMIVISSDFECLSVHSANETIDITPNNFVDSRI